MPNLLQQSGAMGEPSSYAPIHTNRIFTGLWTNRSLLRDAATSEYLERSGMGRQDSILGGYNSEISTRLTLKRRYGNSALGAAYTTPRRFYSFNTFSLTDEVIHVMVDEPGAVYDSVDGTQKNLVWTKSAAAVTANVGTFFLGVGNTLYFTNGVENKQWRIGTDGSNLGISNWGIVGPTTAPVATQAPRPNPFPAWTPSTIHAAWIEIPGGHWNYVVIADLGGYLHRFGTPTGASVVSGSLGSTEPIWNVPGNTNDGTITWEYAGGGWIGNNAYAVGATVGVAISGLPNQLFVAVQAGTSQGTSPNWAIAPKVGMQLSDGATGLVWQNAGPLLKWADIATLKGSGALSNPITSAAQILDTNGYQQTVYQLGTSATAQPSAWQRDKYALTSDGLIIWQNTGAYSVPATAPVIYGYAFMNSANRDTSNMSPKSNPIVVIQGNQVTIQGDGSTDSQVDTIVLYRTAQGGSTFLELATFPNPPVGQKWTYIDNSPDALLDAAWQAQVRGEGTPLPSGATCLGYHLGHIFAAVGNVVYVSAGSDAIASQTSGNAGFNTTFTAQSKITRFWTCSLGMVVFTVRDAYIILGSATANDPLYMVVFIEQIPLLNYDAFTVNKTTPYLLMGNKMLLALDPGAGITEIGFPIADRLRDEYDPKTAYVTFHSESSEETALYVGNKNGQWYRMNQNNSPEQGSAWSTKALVANLGALQSVEVTPGVWSLLWGAAAGSQPLMKRDLTKYTDNGTRAYRQACADHGDRISITLRDRDVVPAGDTGYHDEHC